MAFRFLPLFGSAKHHRLEGPNLVLAYLEDALQMRALLKVEAGAACDVRASLTAFGETGVSLTIQEPVRLAPGNPVDLILFLDGLRFKAGTTLLASSPGSVQLALPAFIQLAERRRRSRACMSLCEGATAIALSGLFSPMLTAATSAIEPSHSVMEDLDGDHPDLGGPPVGPGSPSGVAIASLAGPPPQSLSLSPSGPTLPAVPLQASPAGLEPPPPRTVKIEKPWTKVDVALDSIYWTSFVVDWLQTRTIARNGYTTVSIAEQQVKTATSEYVIHANAYRAETSTERNPILGRHPSTRKVDTYFALSGITYAFMTRNLPEKWRRAYMVTSVTIEAFCVGNNIRLGIRVR